MRPAAAQQTVLYAETQVKELQTFEKVSTLKIYICLLKCNVQCSSHRYVDAERPEREKGIIIIGLVKFNAPSRGEMVSFSQEGCMLFSDCISLVILHKLGYSLPFVGNARNVFVY